jgi:hypothetical protein
MCGFIVLKISFSLDGRGVNKVLFCYEVSSFFLGGFLALRRAVLSMIAALIAWVLDLLDLGFCGLFCGIIFCIEEASIQFSHKELLVSSGYAVEPIAHRSRSKNLLPGIISIALLTTDFFVFGSSLAPENCSSKTTRDLPTCLT